MSTSKGIRILHQKYAVCQTCYHWVIQAIVAVHHRCLSKLSVWNDTASEKYYTSFSDAENQQRLLSSQRAMHNPSCSSGLFNFKSLLSSWDNSIELLLSINTCPFSSVQNSNNFHISSVVFKEQTKELSVANHSLYILSLLLLCYQAFQSSFSDVQLEMQWTQLNISLSKESLSLLSVQWAHFFLFVLRVIIQIQAPMSKCL